MIETIRLPASVRAAMIAHAQEEAPNECCGLLIGTSGSVEDAARAPNIDPEPTRRYLLDPAAHVDANRSLRGTGREVIGCYHSHPRHPAIPSPSDLQDACYPDFVWIIVSLRDSEPDVAAFRIADGAFTPLALRD